VHTRDGITEVLTSLGSPWQNAYAERVMGVFGSCHHRERSPPDPGNGLVRCLLQRIALSSIPWPRFGERVNARPSRERPDHLGVDGRWSLP
jgi:hypothetical protein